MRTDEGLYHITQEPPTVPRGISPVAGVVLLLAITVLLAGTVSVVALGIPVPATPVTPVTATVTATADTNEITITNEDHRVLDVRNLDIRIEIDGTPLEHQPPVPFFSATGFRSGPNGAFNDAANPYWEPGETVSLRIATTNNPQLTPHATLTVRIYRNGIPIATLETRVR